VVDGVKLSVWFGERDRAGDLTSAEAIARATVAAGVRTAVLLRAVEGFGSRGEVLTERLLTLSEDLPLVWAATDVPERIGALADRVVELIPQGLVTLERCRIAHSGDAGRLPDADHLKLTLTIGRGRRSNGGLAYLRAVDILRSAGVDGAYVTLGVDGIAHGERRRARLFGANGAVPAHVVAVGASDEIARALRALDGQVIPALTTIERVRVLARDGQAVASVTHLADPGADDDWQMLTLITREDAVVDGDALHVAMLRAARRSGARGGTAIAGVWGYSGDGAPHGDSMRRLRRGVPVACIVIDTPDAIARLWPTVSRLAAGGGLVISERIPAFRTHGPVGAHGRLHLPHRGDPA
jgi:PII-like signaling protein